MTGKKTMEQKGAALQAAVDRLLPAIQALGPVGRPLLAEGMQIGMATVMAVQGEGGLPGAAVIDAFRDVVLAVHARVGDDR